MELGNIIFGNARGEAEIPREDAWEAPLFALLDAAGCEYHGYPDFENEVFRIVGYDWDAECDCGADETMDAWHKAHPHRPDCYQSELDAALATYDQETGYADLDRATFGGDHTLVDDMSRTELSFAPGITVKIFKPRTDQTMKLWRKAVHARDRFREKIYRSLCKKHKVTYPDGCAVHCTCGKYDAASEFADHHPHSDNCRLIQPNFLHKPSGFRVNWYKYPLRDSYMSPPIKLARWREVMAECLESIAISPPSSTE